jgi:outer membrane receptor protein involved in Fe transport
LNMTEFGVKYAKSWVDFYATLFETKYNSYSISDVIVDPTTLSFTNRTIYGNTDTRGLELDGRIHPVEWFDLNADITLQDPKFSSLKFNEVDNGVLTPVDETGNMLLRVPRTSYRLTPGINLLQGRLRGELDFEYYGKRFADAANLVELPSYDVINFNARYNVNDRLSLHFYADNLNNSLGLTEGNPRQGQITNADVGQSVFIARPIMGRSFRVALRYHF